MSVLNITFIFQEVKKPNGDQYAADSIFYLVLGIQEYLFEVNVFLNLALVKNLGDCNLTFST